VGEEEGELGEGSSAATAGMGVVPQPPSGRVMEVAEIRRKNKGGVG